MSDPSAVFAVPSYVLKCSVDMVIESQEKYYQTVPCHLLVHYPIEQDLMTYT